MTSELKEDFIMLKDSIYRRPVYYLALCPSHAYAACADFSDSENAYCSPLTNALVHCAIVTDLEVQHDP